MNVGEERVLLWLYYNESIYLRAATRALLDKLTSKNKQNTIPLHFRPFYGLNERMHELD